jgi:hypothetical protein
MRTQYTQQLVERAEADADFRARLLGADPRPAIAAELGIELPADLSVRVIEETAGEVVLVLPATDLWDAVSDADLASVAGGSSSDWCVGPDFVRAD